MKGHIKEIYNVTPFFDLPTGRSKILKFWKDIMKHIPAEHAHTTEISVDGNEDDDYRDIVISYWRPETKDEQETRENKEKYYAKHVEDRELKELARLQEKYGLKVSKNNSRRKP